MAGNRDEIRVSLCDTRRDGTHPRLGDELHGHERGGIDLLQVEDQLREILNGIDIVMRGRGDEPHARSREAQLRDAFVDLVARQLAALAGFGTLGHLDLQDFGIHQVLRRHAEAARGDLLDLRTLLSAVADRVLTALTGVGARAEPVHRYRECLVGFG